MNEKNAQNQRRWEWYKKTKYSYVGGLNRRSQIVIYYQRR